jgi:hypothetical protein
MKVGFRNGRSVRCPVRLGLACSATQPQDTFHSFGPDISIWALNHRKKELFKFGLRSVTPLDFSLGSKKEMVELYLEHVLNKKKRKEIFK